MPMKKSAWWKVFVYLVKQKERYINNSTDYMAREIEISRGQVEYGLKVLTAMKLLNYDKNKGFDTQRAKELFGILRYISRKHGKETTRELIIQSFTEWKEEYQKPNHLPVGLAPFSYILDRYSKFPSFKEIVEEKVKNFLNVKAKKEKKIKRR